MKKRIFLSATILIYLCAAVGTAQENRTSAVEVKDDEFSGKRKVTLAEQVLGPAMKMTLSATLDQTRRRSPYEPDLDYAEIEFISPTGGAQFNGADKEVNFMVDGERLRGSQLESGIASDALRKDGKYTAIGVLYLSTLTKIARGREVKMKVGDNVYQLDKTLLKNLQEFVKALGR